MRVAVVGVTGLVGSVMCRILEERNFPVDEFLPVASSKSVGREIDLGNRTWSVISPEEAVGKKPDLALFSAGGSASLEWAPKFAAAGTTVIDNSSAWRMDPTKRLVVPEINAHCLTKQDKIIANPNCSTIQMVMVLAPLHRVFNIKRIVVSTYQSVTGTGIKAVHQFELEKKNHNVEKDQMAYPHPIFENCLPHCDVFLENDYTKEEMKLVNETRKILDDQQISITSTAVRVPVKGGHSESVNIEFRNSFELEDVRNLLSSTPGIQIYDDVKNNIYPMPVFAEGKDDVFVGRIRRDHSIEHGLNLWIVSDNLRKGAATNAIQIAEYLYQNRLV
jgi:aspartate-semialdehyde dehydrogenase